MPLAASRYEIKNGNAPTTGNITEEKEIESEKFGNHTKIVMSTLGHKIFEPIDAVPIQPIPVPKKDSRAY